MFENYSHVRLLTDKFRAEGIRCGHTGLIIEIWDEDHYYVDFASLEEMAAGIEGFLTVTGSEIEAFNPALTGPRISGLSRDVSEANALSRLAQQVAEYKIPDDPASPGGTHINPRDGAEMVLIPAGLFLMGDPGQFDNPPRIVRLSDYWMYKKRVTVGQYAQFCEAAGRTMPDAPNFNAEWANKDHPIVNVSWIDAAAYAEWPGMGLPTEAEWEKGARGTDGRAFPWGAEFDDIKESISTNQNRFRTVPTGEYSEGGPYGLLDMVSNVSQRCADWYDIIYAISAPPADPEGPPEGRLRALRGGGLVYYHGDVVCVALRKKLEPDSWGSLCGFRCGAGLQGCPWHFSHLDAGEWHPKKP